MFGRLAGFVAVAIAALSTLGAAQSAPDAGTVAGRVVEAGTKSPIADARVMLVPTTRPAPGQMPRTREATSSADGAFRFEGLEPGTYRLTVQKPGFVGPAPGVAPMLTIQAGGAPVARVITLQRGAVIAGRVLTPNGQPVAEARVTALRRAPLAPEQRLVMTGQSVVTNDLGEFRLHSLASGEYFLQASPRPTSPMSQTAPVSKTITETYYPGTTSATAAQALSVTAGATTSGIEIALLEVPAFSVRGAVVDEAGRPVENASVMLVAGSAAGVPVFNGPGRARTSSDGQFRIDGVVAGTYLVRAAAPAVTKSDPKPGVVDAPLSGVVGPLSSGLSASGGSGGASGFAFMTETAGGVTTTYRFDESRDVRILVEGTEVTDVQIVVKRSQP